MVLDELSHSIATRQLLEWGENPTSADVLYLLLCICLVLFAGCMSGLTLGLMSMDKVELEVLKRSGTLDEQRYAQRILPVVSNAHYLLVTLLLCNAAAMEALPIVLDKLVHEVVAIIISVTAVLFFGEIIPQAVCSKHGLMIGAAMAVPVRCLMILTAPLSWPIGKLLDFLLGGEEASLFRRNQLKALVSLHAKGEGFGGKLTNDEIQVITGALDLTKKTAYTAMTPLEKVFMLSTNQKLDDATVESIMAAKPFSRLPVYRGDAQRNIIGVILVKELLEYVKKYPDSPVSSLRIRPLPRLSASTPMYDMLKLFRTGRSHMALLTQPEEISWLRRHHSGRHSQDLSPRHSHPPGTTSHQPLHAISNLDGKPLIHSGMPRSDHLINMPATAAAAEHGNSNGAASAGSVVSLKSRVSISLTSISKAPMTRIKSLFKKESLHRHSSLDPKANDVAHDYSHSHEQHLHHIPRANSHNPYAGGAYGQGSETSSSGAAPSHLDDADLEDMMPAVPQIAQPGEAIGIITIEDVIEELMQFEIADETDKFLDNEQSILVSSANLEQDLPTHLKAVLSMADFAKASSLITTSLGVVSKGTLLGVAAGLNKDSSSPNKLAGLGADAMRMLRRTASLTLTRDASGKRPAEAVANVNNQESAPLLSNQSSDGGSSHGSALHSMVPPMSGGFARPFSLFPALADVVRSRATTIEPSAQQPSRGSCSEAMSVKVAVVKDDKMCLPAGECVHRAEQTQQQARASQEGNGGINTTMKAQPP